MALAEHRVERRNGGRIQRDDQHEPKSSQGQGVGTAPFVAQLQGPWDPGLAS